MSYKEIIDTSGEIEPCECGSTSFSKIGKGNMWCNKCGKIFDNEDLK